MAYGPTTVCVLAIYVFLLIDLLRNPIWLSPVRKYSINAIKTSSHSPLLTGSQKSYTLVDESVTGWRSCCTCPVSQMCCRYMWGNLAWYSRNEVWVINITKAYCWNNLREQGGRGIIRGMTGWYLLIGVIVKFLVTYSGQHFPQRFVP